MRNNHHRSSRRIWVSIVAGGLIVGCFTSTGARAQELGPKPAEEVRRAAVEFFHALDELSADELGRLMTENCVSVIPGPGGVTTIPRSDYLGRVRALKAVQSNPPPKRGWRDLELRLTGHAAVMTAFTGPLNEDGKLVEEAFVSTFWAYQGGRWKVSYSQRAPAGSAGEVARWNDVFRREAGFKLDRNALLADAVKGVKPGKALDVGMGQGRNSV